MMKIRLLIVFAAICAAAFVISSMESFGIALLSCFGLLIVTAMLIEVVERILSDDVEVRIYRVRPPDHPNCRSSFEVEFTPEEEGDHMISFDHDDEALKADLEELSKHLYRLQDQPEIEPMYGLPNALVERFEAQEDVCKN